MTEQNTKQLIHRLKTISNDRLVQYILSSMACAVIAEAADRLEELEKSETFLKERVDVAIKDREYYESESKSRLEGLLGATEANRISLDRIAELEKQLSDLKAKRQPLSVPEIREIGETFRDNPNPDKFITFARAIEKAHGIGGDV